MIRPEPTLGKGNVPSTNAGQESSTKFTPVLVSASLAAICCLVCDVEQQGGKMCGRASMRVSTEMCSRKLICSPRLTYSISSSARQSAPDHQTTCDVERCEPSLVLEGA